MATRNRTKNRSAGRFGGLPLSVWNHPDYQGLSGSAVKLLMDLACQYNGYNNGDLTTAFSVLSKRGWTSKQTVARAVKELMEADLIIRTREGVFQNPGAKCALYAIAWQSIDECKGKIDVRPTLRPPRAFSLENNQLPRPESGPGSVLAEVRVRTRDDAGRFMSTREVDRPADRP